MSNESPSSSGSIGFFGLLGLIFITLKLCGVIHWSWWWVTAPLWGPLAFLLLCAVVGFLVVSLAWVVTLFVERR
jgi:hypothetical protein